MAEGPKNEAAAALVRLRWAKTTPEQRSAYARKMLDARWKKNREKKRKTQSKKGIAVCKETEALFPDDILATLAKNRGKCEAITQEIVIEHDRDARPVQPFLDWSDLSGSR